MIGIQTAALLLSASLVGQEAQRFRVEVNRVHIDVFVSREEPSARRLTAADFEVFDEGVKQVVDVVDARTVPRTFTILLDESGSVSGGSREVLREAAVAFTAALKPEDELAVLGFAERTEIRKPLGFGAVSEPAGVLEIGGSGWTALQDAVFLAITYLRNARGRPILVIFTDGIDNASWIDEPAILESARFSEAVVYNVMARAEGAGVLEAGGSSGRSVAMLKDLATVTGGRTLQADKPEEVLEAVNTVLSEVSTLHVLSFSPGAGAKPGWHELQVKVKGVRDADVRTRAGYFRPAGDR